MTRLYIIGAGAIAHEHAKASLKQSPAPELRAADPSPAARDAFAKDFPHAVLFSSPEEMLAPPALPDDVVVVATPPWLHTAHTLAALRSGRHVLCEKPLATSVTEATQLATAAAIAGKHLLDCSCRFSARPITREIRRRVLAGEIGRSLRVRWQSRSESSRCGIEYQPESRWFLDKAKAGGGCMLDWGCYDLAVWVEIFQPIAITVESAWLGYPERGELPAGVVCNVEHQASASLRLHLPDGRTVPVAYERSAASHGGGFEIMQIEGERGALDWDWLDWQGSKIRHHRADKSGATVVDTIEWTADDGLGCHDRPLRAMAALLREKNGATPAGNLTASHFTVLAAIYESAHTRLPKTVYLHS